MKKLVGLAVAVCLMGMASAAWAVSISGNVQNQSVWRNSSDLFPPVPGDGSGQAPLLVGVWNSQGNIQGTPLTSQVLRVRSPLPLSPPFPPYSVGNLSSPLPDGGYIVLAWIDGNNNGQYDLGEPSSAKATVSISGQRPVEGVNVTIVDDADNDGLPDWWEAHWFGNLEQPGEADPDADGLLTIEEYMIYARYLPLGNIMKTLSPAHWDSDGDSMDDKWEYDHYYAAASQGLNPTVPNQGAGDIDGDGLSNGQEYCGQDGIPRMALQAVSGGIASGRMPKSVSDDLNPLDIDTDLDLLLDPFEVAWYNPLSGIDPKSGTSNLYSIAKADPDQDGLANYREQCLLAGFRETGVNSNAWLWSTNDPFVSVYYTADDGASIRFAPIWWMQNGNNLNFGLNPALPVTDPSNLAILKNQEWTDPGSADTDADQLPDGWEVEFNLDPRNSVGVNGRFGDPDGDRLSNWEEYIGQDGLRYATKPYVNGTGDETNPNRHNWRPDFSYLWRWYPVNMPYSWLTDPRVGWGIDKYETLGGALPTRSIGSDAGADSDDDGITDSAELARNWALGIFGSSPVHSMDPFVPRAARIVSAAGIPIPDPNPAQPVGYAPAGTRRDLQRRDWTLECQVYLSGGNLSGYLFNFETSADGKPAIVYRLELVNNVPILTSQNGDGAVFSVAGGALPQNRWIHLAGVRDSANNTLALYIQGVLFMGQTVYGECASSLMFPAVNTLALASSQNGSFVDKLSLDEVRIWGLARTADQIAQYAGRLVPQYNGDDVWSNAAGAYYYSVQDSVLVNGGSLFEGEPGVPISNVYRNADNYWIDNGNGEYNQSRDILLYRGSAPLPEGTVGAPQANILYNDKDGSGGFTRESLLAYYRFDDGGTAAEDFARKAKNGLLGATAESYQFGDRGYALPLSGFAWTASAAPTLGVDARGADDSDQDGMPDAWEMINHLDPFDDGTGEETSPGAKDGPNGPLGDPDLDGLINIYEFWSDTNPRDADSHGSGVSDAQEDLDADGVVNIVEQSLDSRPDMMDTDDDSKRDNTEQAAGSNPADPMDPPKSLAMRFGGAAGDYLDVPIALKQKLDNWTIEMWVNPAATAAARTPLLRRAVQRLDANAYAVNYEIGLQPDGAGGMRFYAGYILAQGSAAQREKLAASTARVPTGQWTHVAATYDSVTATLSLYANGAPDSSVNSFFASPPVNGSGDTFLRIGEGFAGLVDEVRLWSLARLPSGIASTYTTTVAGSSANLTHYFRFDDREAVTNGIAFGKYYQPHGPQDFTFSRDWNRQWRHAAKRVGNVQFASPGKVDTPPSLRIDLSPTEAVLAGARWSIDGGATWLNSGATIYDLAAGLSSIVVYKPASGWSAPPAENVTLAAGAATVLNRAYWKNGSLQVILEPIEARTAGAAWKVDNGDWLASGAVATNLAPGTHALQFQTVDNWLTPATTSIVILAGQTRTYAATYAKPPVGIAVAILPAAAVAAGAQWRVNGGTWLDSGYLQILSNGTYTVGFKNITGWLRPIDVVTQLTENMTAVYYPIQFWDKPPLSGGGTFDKPRGLVLDSRRKLYVADSMNHRILVADMNAPTGALWQVIGGYGTGLGQFNQPMDLAMDRYDNLYVCEAANNRVQMRSAATLAWTNWGGAWNWLFNSPLGMAVDTNGVVYVADTGNHRIMKRALTGVWSVFMGNQAPSSACTITNPQDVAVGGDGSIYVADIPGGKARIRVVTPDGNCLEEIGNDTASLGELSPVRSVAVDPVGARLGIADRDRGMVVARDLVMNSWVTLIGSQCTLNRPEGIAFDNQGVLYLSDTYNDRVLRLSLNILAANSLWAGAVNLGGGWKWLSWFGFFMDTGTGWIYHNEHEWMYSTGTSTSSIWFWTQDMGWLWSGDALYPFLYRLTGGTWLWYLKDSNNPRWFYNTSAGLWETWW